MKSSMLRGRALFVLCVLLPVSPLCSQDSKQTKRTYWDNFRHVCNAPRAATQRILRTPTTESLQAVRDTLIQGVATRGITLKAKNRPAKLRIAAEIVDPGKPDEWQYFETADGRVWVDLLRYESSDEEIATMKKRGQDHSGEMAMSASTFITIRRADGRDAVCGIVCKGSMVVNVGRSLPFKVLTPPSPHAPEGSAGENSQAEILEIRDSIDTVVKVLESVADAIVHPNAIMWIPPRKPSDEQLRDMRVAGFVRVWSEADRNFPFFDKRPELHWDSVLELYLPRVRAAKSDDEYVGILEEVVALLRDGHSWVFPRGYERPETDQPPILVDSVDGRAVITHVANVPELKAADVSPGLEIVSVEGVQTADFLKQNIYPRISASTPQDRVGRAYRRFLRGKPGTPVQVRLRDPDGGVRDVALSRNSKQHRDKLKWRSLPPFEFRRIGDDIAYVAINTFADQSVVRSLDESFDKILAAKGLIIDVRRNGGGSTSSAYAVIARLISKPCSETSRWQTRQYRPAYRSWGKKEDWYTDQQDPIKPYGAKQFSGPVMVLTSPATYSASEDFLVPLKASKRATLVGQTTGGSTGNPLVFEVHAATVGIVSKWDSFADGTEFVGIGIKPDIEVAPTQKDIAAGRDVVLERAVEHLSK